MEIINIDIAATKRFTLIVTTVGAFLTPFGISSVNIALPAIGKEFLMDAILLSWVTTAYVLASAIFLVPFGKVADIYGRKRIFTYGVLTFTFASFGSSFSNSGITLVGFRILQGMGGTTIYCIGAAMLTSVFPPRELGKVLGINLAAVYSGSSMGPFLGGFLTQHLGWRSIFFANALVGLIILFFIFWKLKGEWRVARDEKFDLPGAIIYTITFLLIMYGFSHLSTLLGASLILPGILGVLIFIKWEKKRENPVLDINLFRNNRVFAFSNLSALIHYSATFAVTFLLSLYLQYIKALTPQNAGLILVCQPIVQTFFSPLSGKLSDRVEPRIVSSIGMALTAAGLFLFTFLNGNTPIGFIIGSLAFLGFGFAIFVSPNTNAVMSSVEERFYGMASGTLGTMRMAGMVFSMGVTILIFSIYLGEVQITPENYPIFLRCMKISFTFLAVLCCGGIFASLARGNIR
jgi:EmrB/QacA subfamily drug resistance transporter